MEKQEKYVLRHLICIFAYIMRIICKNKICIHISSVCTGTKNLEPGTRSPYPSGTRVPGITATKSSRKAHYTPLHLAWYLHLYWSSSDHKFKSRLKIVPTKSCRFNYRLKNPDKKSQIRIESVLRKAYVYVLYLVLGRLPSHKANLTRNLGLFFKIRVIDLEPGNTMSGGYPGTPCKH